MASECSTSHMTPHMYWFLFTRTGSHHSPWNYGYCQYAHHHGPRFSIRYHSVKTLKVRSREVSKPRDWFMFLASLWNCWQRRLGSTAADVPLKFQSDGTISNPNLAASRLHRILRWDVLSGSIGYWNGSQAVSWWAVNCESARRFRSVSFMNVVSGVSGKKYRYQLFNATIRHPTSQTYTYHQNWTRSAKHLG